MNELVGLKSADVEKISVKETQSKDIVKEFIMHDKYKILERGFEMFYFISDEYEVYEVKNVYLNIYAWRKSGYRSRIRMTKVYNQKYKIYDSYMKYDCYPYPVVNK